MRVEAGCPGSVPNGVPAMNKLNSKKHLKEVEKATKMAHEALKHYGEPTMTLAELGAAMDKELKGISLSDLIIKDREAGW